MNISHHQIIELEHLARISDMEVRTDLAAGFINGEDDYTSNFTSTFRRNICAHSRTGLKATSFLVPMSIERKLGVDATIIISGKKKSKILFFEAKLPRFSISGHRWDHPQTSTGLSHFSDQLNRQTKIQSSFVVFEMFYNDYPLGAQHKPLYPDCSSCVLLNDILSYNQTRNKPDLIWTQADLLQALSVSSISIGQILMDTASCKLGSAVEMTNHKDIIREYAIEGNILAIEAGNDEGLSG